MDGKEKALGARVLMRAMQAPTRWIAARMRPAITARSWPGCSCSGYGFDVVQDKIDTTQAGILDPLKVVRTALETGASTGDGPGRYGALNSPPSAIRRSIPMKFSVTIFRPACGGATYRVIAPPFSPRRTLRAALLHAPELRDRKSPYPSPDEAPGTPQPLGTVGNAGKR